MNKCFVGHKPNTNQYSVACDGGDGGGRFKLTKAGYTSIVLGPTSWDACVAYMRERGQAGW